MLILTEEEYLAINGVGRNTIGDSALHKNKGNNSDKIWTKIINTQANKDRKILERREQLRNEYNDKVLNGEIRTPTRTERLIDIANGNNENESVRAARRLLDKKGIKWQN